MSSLKEKSALVTGGARGIGRAMRKLLLTRWWMASLIAVAGCGMFASSNVEYYDDGVVAVCHPATWTLVHNSSKPDDLEGVTLQRAGASASFLTFAAPEKYDLSSFQLAQYLASDLGVKGSIREPARTAVFAGAEGSRIIFGPATTKDGPAALVVISALIRSGRLYVGIGAVQPGVEESVQSELTSIMESGRFSAVPQLPNYRRGREDCSSNNDSRIEGVWVNTRDGNHTSEYRFDDGDYTENVLGRWRRRGRYSVKGGILTITPSGGKAVSCRYTINGKQLVLRNCNADFPTIFWRQ